MIRIAAGEKLEAQAGRREARRLGGRKPHLRRGPLPQLPALDRPARALPPAQGGHEPARHHPQRHRRVRGRRDLHPLRSHDRQAGDAWRHARGRHRPAGRRARRLRHRRGRAQHPFPLRPHAASALARGSAVHRLHRRGIQGRLQAAPAPRSCSYSRPWPSPSITSPIRGDAGSPSRWAARRCALPAGASPRSATRGCWPRSRARSQARSRSRSSTSRASGATPSRCSRTGGRASRCGPAWCMAAPCRCRCARSSTAMT